MRQRGFEKVKRVKEEDSIFIPRRGTKHSAGYDFFSPDKTLIPALGKAFIHTGIKAYMLPDECLFLYPRSSYGIKHSIVLQNTVGVVDSDYYDNEKNEGEIIVALYNGSKEDFTIEKGDRFCQGTFKKILLADQDNPLVNKREGGFGSTNKGDNNFSEDV